MKLNDKVKSRVHLIYGITLSVMLAVLGVLFICSCYSIYKSGSSPFTRESIGEAFSRIAIPTYLTVAVVIGGGILSVVLPKEEPRLVAFRSSWIVLSKLSGKLDLNKLDGELKEKIEKERKLRRLLDNINVALLTFSAIAPLFYVLNPANFPAVSGEYNAEISHGMLVYLAFLAPLAIYEVVYVILFDLSCKREIELTKVGIKEAGVSHVEYECHDCVMCRVSAYLKKNKKPILLGIRIALVCYAIVFIVLGIANGGMADVLNKAVNICTECIGLG